MLPVLIIYENVHDSQVLARERELFSRAFPLDNDDVSKSLAAFVESLGSLLQEIFRPRYIPINDICVIADLIDTLRNQVLYILYRSFTFVA